jgi:dienelactone hydrolase
MKIKSIICLLLLSTSVKLWALETIQLPSVKNSYVSFQTYDPSMLMSESITVAARLSVPIRKNKVPAVIIVHGSGGVDERGDLYRRSLNLAGVATLELDMWAARGLDGGLSRPSHVRETLPDVYGAIRFIQSRTDIEGENLGLIGFSWGGVVAMLMSGEPYELALSLTGLVANYPVCWAYNKVSGYPFTHVNSGQNLLVIAGMKDEYDDPEDCEILLANLPKENQSQVSLLKLKNATHAFELPRPESTFYDPFAFRGVGGEVTIKFNPIATARAVFRATVFLKSHISMNQACEYELCLNAL